MKGGGRTQGLTLRLKCGGGDVCLKIVSKGMITKEIMLEMLTHEYFGIHNFICIGINIVKLESRISTWKSSVKHTENLRISCLLVGVKAGAMCAMPSAVAEF